MNLEALKQRMVENLEKLGFPKDPSVIVGRCITVGFEVGGHSRLLTMRIRGVGLLDPYGDMVELYVDFTHLEGLLLVFLRGDVSRKEWYAICEDREGLSWQLGFFRGPDTVLRHRGQVAITLQLQREF